MIHSTEIEWVYHLYNVYPYSVPNWRHMSRSSFDAFTIDVRHKLTWSQGVQRSPIWMTSNKIKMLWHLMRRGISQWTKANTPFMDKISASEQNVLHRFIYCHLSRHLLQLHCFCHSFKLDIWHRGCVRFRHSDDLQEILGCLNSGFTQRTLTLHTL